jgi:hypothetical protein
MSIKNSLLETIQHDLSICQHLHSKLDASKANWRPQPNMRSTEELMQYLAFIGKVTVNQFINPPADRSAAMPNYTSVAAWAEKNVTFSNFSEMIELQKKEIAEAFGTLTDAELMTRTTYAPWDPRDQPLLGALLSSVKFVCAYRHQLFLYGKQQGVSLNTMNNWAGMDSPQAQSPLEQEVANSVAEENA